MKLPLLSLLAAVLALSCASAQSLSPTVVSTSGAFYSNGTGMLSSTIGEMAMVQTFSAGSSILNQGFQQAFDFNTGIYNPTVSNGLNIFPNPTSGDVTIQLQSSYNGEVNASVYDAIGKLVRRQRMEKLSGSANTFVLSLEDLVDGMYFFEVQTNSERFAAKINLVK